MEDVDHAHSQDRDNIWYIEVSGGIEGPFSKDQLKRDGRISPDTYVWRQGFADWKKIRDVPELSDLFEEPPLPKKKEEPLLGPLDEELALEHPPLTPPFPYWLIVFIIVLIYMLFYHYSRK